MVTAGGRCVAPRISKPARWVLLLAFTVTVALSACAQSPGDSSPALPGDAQEAIIEAVSEALLEEYVFADVADSMVSLVRRKFTEGAYSTITDPEDFALRLTEDLRSVSHDRHLMVRALSDEDLRGLAQASSDELQRRRLEELRRRNFGFKKVEILRGNVGYLDLRFFADARLAGETAIAAMKFLANSSALIVDLRNNNGGQPSMIQLLSSYLFERPVHLNSFYIRKGNSTKEFWTQGVVDGSKLIDVPVYVLTSGATFSGAEEFAYNLKHLKRAVIVGEQTGGGAHPVNRRVFQELKIAVAVPYGRAVNPITGTNWEGVGVTPDLEVRADRALGVAHVEAVKELLGRISEEPLQGKLRWLMEELAVQADGVSVPDSVLEACAGTFGPRSIRFADGTLYYRRQGRPEYRLIPMGDDRFLVESLDYFRIQFRRDHSGKVFELVGQYDNGDTDGATRNP